MAAVAGGRRQKPTTLRLRAQTPRKFHLPNIVNEDRFRIPGVDVNPINLECYPNKILYKPARLKRVSGSEGLSFHKMEEYLTSFSILLASLLLLFFLLPILFKNNSTAAIFWHTVLEEKVAMLMTGTSRENRILQYVMQNAVQGDAKSVVENIDKYCREKEWAMNVGDEKGAILDRVLEETNPSTVLELGTYCGYSALRIIRVLKPGARLMTVEFNPINADIARQIFHFAGVEEKVEILEGASQDIIPQLTRQHKVDTVDFVFLDHWKDRYQPDTQLLEECGLLRTGSVLLADNVISPGAPEFLQYVRNNPRYVCTHYASHLEYTTINDGMEKAIYKGPVCVKISER